VNENLNAALGVLEGIQQSVAADYANNFDMFLQIWHAWLDTIHEHLEMASIGMLDENWNSAVNGLQDCIPKIKNVLSEKMSEHCIQTNLKALGQSIRRLQSQITVVKK